MSAPRSHHDGGQLFGTDGHTSSHEPSFDDLLNGAEKCSDCGYDCRSAAHDRWCEMCGGIHDGTDTAQGFTCAGCGGTTAYVT